MLQIDRAEALFDDAARRSSGPDAARCILEMLGVGYHTPSPPPPPGPLLVVANHPHGGTDALALIDWLLLHRPDTRILANRMLAHIPALGSYMIPVDVFSQHPAPHNAAGLRAAARHLRSGGCLLTFPAGEISHWHWHSFRVEDPAWSTHIGSLWRIARCPALPVHVAGTNSPLFHLAGLFHPMARTALLTREFFLRRHTQVSFTAATPLAPPSPGSSPQSLIAQLRDATYQLAR